MNSGTTHDPAAENRVFISTVTDEFERGAGPFREVRTRLRGYLTSADCEVKVQEDIRQTNNDLVVKLDGYIRRCAAVIHLVGEMPGATANPKAVSEYLATVPDFLHNHPELRVQLGDCADLTYTQWEAFIALHHGVELFVYATENGTTAQRNQLARLRVGRKFFSPISDPADLYGRLIGDLRYIIPAFGQSLQRISQPRFLHHAAELFLGREAELEMLDKAWAAGINVLSLIAWGGVGKTSLMAEWVQTRFIDRQWKDAEGRPNPLAYFDWSFYDQGTRSLDDRTSARTGNVGDFFEQALTFFGDRNPSAPGKGRRLAELVRQQRTLFILDGLEPLQQPLGHAQAGRLLDPDLREFLVSLAAAHPGLCVITSRQAVTDLHGLHGRAAESRDLDDLPKSVAVRLLRKMQVAGSDKELEEASEKFGCHALSLTLLGRFLVDAHGGDIRRIDRVRDLHHADDLTREERHRTAKKVLAAYDEWLATAQADGNPRTLAVLRLTGLFDRPATPDCLAALRARPVIPGLTDSICVLADDEWNILLKRLDRIHLIKLRPSPSGQFGIDAHPLVREYFAHKLKQTEPQAWSEAHRRLYEHLCETTQDKPHPTLEELQPLYQAIKHGCEAGLAQEVYEKIYRVRIIRGRRKYATRRLGAFDSDLAAIACFFEHLWSRAFPDLTANAQSWLLNAAGYSLRALGRLTEALDPMRDALEMVLEQMQVAMSTGSKYRTWSCAAYRVSNLSELELALGDLASAVRDAEKSVTYAESDNDAYHRIARRTTLATALHHAGRKSEAFVLLKKAEEMQADYEPNFQMLYSTRGYRYCDLLLDDAERGAWQSLLEKGGRQLRACRHNSTKLVTTCRDIKWRANQTLRIAIRKHILLDIGLDHVTVARGALYAYMFTLQQCEINIAKAQIHHAVNSLRGAGDLTRLPLGLLTRAWLRSLTGHRIGLESAQSDLDEAWEIAERGPMPLFLADIHLYRARLFGSRNAEVGGGNVEEERYPWESVEKDLAEARRLIVKHGYLRRMEELKDAEHALLGTTGSYSPEA